MSDIVVELSHYVDNGYYLRTFEIIKARFQPHVLGKHQFKILGDPNKNQANTDILSREHPVRKDGGIFIFPSVHFYLSEYRKFQQTNELLYDATSIDELTSFLSIGNDKDTTKPLDGGFPKGRCTAFIGCRGGHKSHLAYLHVLARLTKQYPGGSTNRQEDAALIVSLRDDEMMIQNTLTGILQNEFENNNKNIKEDYIEAGKLEILYYPPGYISPEEFINRIFVSIHKLKQKAKNVTVIFNSLDQLAARFPLCAKLDIFIPSIIQILIGESVTSIFVAVDEKDQPAEQYGLLPMADLILSFHQYRIDEAQYKDIIEPDVTHSTTSNKRDHIIITVERFAGGKKGGSKGLLEYHTDSNKRKTMKFSPLLDNVYLNKSQFKK